MIIEIIIALLAALTIINLSYYYLRHDLVISAIAQFNTNEHWRAILLGMVQSTLGFNSPGVSYLSLSSMSTFNSDAMILFTLWLLMGLLIGVKSKSWKQAIFLGFITPLSQSQLYIMMLQQYTPALWQSFSASLQQQIEYSAYYNGLLLGLFMIIGLLVPTLYHIYCEKKTAKVTYIIPEEKRVKLEIKCPKCGEIHYSNALYCSNCGTLLHEDGNTVEDSE